MSLSNILKQLPNVETKASDDIKTLAAKAAREPQIIVGSGLWFDAEDYDHLEAYDRAYAQLRTLLSEAFGQPAAQGLGFDPDSGEPIPALEVADIYCDQYAFWPAQGFALTIAQEDKELPIEIMLQPLTST